MPLDQIEQPRIIQINEWLRLSAYQGEHDFALAWYQDPEVYYNSEGIQDGLSLPDMDYVDRMYLYLNAVSELYFIEVLEDGIFKPIGDTAVKAKNPPIVIGEKKYRGRGIGKLVLKMVIERAKTIGIEKIYDTVIFDYNLPSQKLHESLGYVCVGKKGKLLMYELNLK